MAWREVRDTLAIDTGARCGCVFCAARKRDRFKDGDLIYVLTGLDAGKSGRVVNAGYSDSSVINVLYDTSKPDELVRLSFDELSAPLGDLVVASWMPDLKLKHMAQFEQFVCGFVTDCFIGDRFASDDIGAANMVSGIWANRNPVSGDVVARAAIAHGMPSHFQTKLAEYFDFAQLTLISARQRKPLPSQIKRNEVLGQFSDALRYSYKLHDLS